MPAIFETNTLSDYQGTLEARTFETGPGPVYTPTNVIRSDQNWGVEVNWEVHGPLATWLDAEFRISVFLESMGPGPEYSLAPVCVHTKSVPVGANASGEAQRVYNANVDVNAGNVQNGVYKVLVVIQLFELGSGSPTPFAGFIESGMVYLFDPA